MIINIQDNNGLIWTYKDAEIEVYTDYIFVYTDSHVHWKKPFRTSEITEITITKEEV